MTKLIIFESIIGEWLLFKGLFCYNFSQIAAEAIK